MATIKTMRLLERKTTRLLERFLRFKPLVAFGSAAFPLEIVREVIKFLGY